MPESSRADRVFASIFCLGSQTLKRFPSLNARLVGPDKVPEGWQRLQGWGLMAAPHWTTIQGDPHGPRLPIPAKYKIAHMLSINRSEMIDAHRKYDDGRDALLLRFGGELVVGAMAAGEHFAELRGPFNVNKFSVSLRSGRGDQAVVGGVYSPRLQEFVPAMTEEARAFPINTSPAGVPIL